MLIEVTQEHIDKGERSNALSCPVALAVREALDAKKENEVAVSFRWITHLKEYRGWRTLFQKTQDWISYPSPKKVQEFITDFDNGEPVAPFSFELKQPPQEL